MLFLYEGGRDCGILVGFGSLYEFNEIKYKRNAKWVAEE